MCTRYPRASSSEERYIKNTCQTRAHAFGNRFPASILYLSRVSSRVWVSRHRQRHHSQFFEFPRQWITGNQSHTCGDRCLQRQTWLHCACLLYEITDKFGEPKDRVRHPLMLRPRQGSHHNIGGCFGCKQLLGQRIKLVARPSIRQQTKRRQITQPLVDVGCTCGHRIRKTLVHTVSCQPAELHMQSQQLQQL